MKWLAHLFVFFCFFPYLNILNIGTDTQPNALILGALILFVTSNKKLTTPILLLWSLFGISFLLFGFSDASLFDTIKNSLNYLSPPLVSMAAYALFSKYGYRFSFSSFLTVILLYGFVGSIQLYIYPDFLTSLINMSGRGLLVGGRGVVSLCPEPAFYGTLCLFFLVFSLLTFSKRQNYIAIPILLFQLLVLSRAATATFMLIAAVAIFLLIQLVRFRLKYIFITLVLIFITTTSINYFKDSVKDTRMGSLVETFVEEPLLITQIDNSVGIRVTGTVAPFLSQWHNNLMPMGLGYYKPFLKKLYTSGQHRSLLTPDIINFKDRLGGSMNMVLFQLGFLGLLMPLAIFLAFRQRLKDNRALFSLILFTCILFSQIQMMHAMIGLIIALAMTTKPKRLSGKTELLKLSTST